MNPDAISGEADVAEDQSASRMDPKIKAQWVAALRSGEYKQGGGQLHNSIAGEFCCLGVLCDLAVKAEVDVRVQPGAFGTEYDGQTGSLPAAVQEWARLDTPDPELAPTIDQDNDEDIYYWDEASELNDTGVPFSQIADLIEWGL
jgi:hypothetical protein